MHEKTALEIADDLMAEATMAANRANVSSDDYDVSATVRIAASTLRRQYARIAGYRAMLAAAPQAPAAPIAGLPIEQEPKYTVSGSHIVNRSSGEPVPRDEPEHGSMSYGMLRGRLLRRKRRRGG